MINVKVRISILAALLALNCGAGEEDELELEEPEVLYEEMKNAYCFIHSVEVGGREFVPQ